jgi:Tfp pilus assembly major pilin PilA
MVVIAIIGIITAIAIPYYNNYKATACDQAALADMYNIKAAVQKYITDETLKGTAVSLDVGAATGEVVKDGNATPPKGTYGYPGPTKKCGVTVSNSGSVVTALTTMGTTKGKAGWTLDMAGGGQPQ